MSTRIQMNGGDRLITIHGDCSPETVQNILAQKIREEEGQGQGQTALVGNEAEEVLLLPTTMAYAAQPPKQKVRGKPAYPPGPNQTNNPNLPQSTPHPMTPAQQPQTPDQPASAPGAVKFSMLDGTSIVVHGPSAQEVANILSSQLHLTANSSLVTGLDSSPEEVLQLPVLNFDKPASSAAIANNGPQDDEDEECLALPRMSF